VRKWRRFRRLAAPDRASLLWAFILVPATAAALHTIGLRRWKAFLKPAAPRNGTSPVDPSEQQKSIAIESARRTARMVAAAAKEGVYDGRCLEQSLTLWWLLARRALPAELHIGVRKGAAGFEAHAWVELFGAVVNDGDEVRQDYVPFGRDIASLGIEPQ
jgi:hypothetical protein